MHRPRFYSSPKQLESHMTDDDVTGNDLADDTLSVADLEGDTIIKQRRELQLLIGELKDRDRELNEMVAAHKQQLNAWERDRQKALTLEQKNERLETEVRKRNEQLRLLIQRLKVSESRHRNKDSIIEETRTKLYETEKVLNNTSAITNELQSKNEVLNTSLNEVCSSVGRLEAKEQEFVTQLQLKEGDLIDAESQISEIRSKFRRLESELKDSQQDGLSTRAELEQQRNKFRLCRAELDKTSAEMATKTGEIITLRQEVTKFRDEIQRITRELYLCEESMKRKEELIELQKSKQDRSDYELTQLRQLYERQQQELTLLQLNLENSQDMLAKQEERLNCINLNSLDVDNFDNISQTTNDLLEEARKYAEEDPLAILGTSSMNRVNLERSHHQQLNFPPSPTSKLQKLLTETREMAHHLERSAYSPKCATRHTL